MSAALPDDLVDCLKRVAAALRDGGVPFALGGGLAAWARGGPRSEHDVDATASAGCPCATSRCR